MRCCFRDGSDYSASIFGKLLQASAVQIWTDVDGVLSADPRKVPEAKVLPEVRTVPLGLACSVCNVRRGMLPTICHADNMLPCLSWAGSGVIFHADGWNRPVPVVSLSRTRAELEAL